MISNNLTNLFGSLTAFSFSVAVSSIRSVLNSSCRLPLFFDRCRRRPKYSLKCQITGFTQNKRLKIFIIYNNGNENTIH